MMRLLFLTARLPYPPNRGDRLRAFNFLRSLAREHEIHLISFVAHESERESLPALQPFCRAIHLVKKAPLASAVSVGVNLWRRDPLQVLYYRSGAMQSLVDRVLAENRFDAAYVHLFRMAPFVARHSGLYRIVDLTDVISEEVARSMPYRGLASRLLFTVERPRIGRYERAVAGAFEESWLISEADRRLLAQACPGANIQVVGNGVDRERFHPTGERADPYHLAFVGHLSVFHNVDAATHLARDILPRVRREIPNVTLDLIGAEPNAPARALGEIPGVRVPGFVDDLNAALNRAAVFAAPLRFAAGVQNKVLEAMAAGRPVVTTSLVNAGLGAQAGRDLLTADDPESAAQAIVRLLRDDALQKELGAAGLAFVRAHYNWDLVLRRVNEIEHAAITQIRFDAISPLLE